MISHQDIFRALLIASCGYALWRGRSDERIVAVVCLTATVATRIAISPVSVRYSRIEAGVLLIDLAVFAAFLLVALRSQRFWPLWVAGLQLTSSLGHVIKAVDLQLLPRAYGAAIVLWSYPILIILAIGTWRGRRRVQSKRNQQSAA